ncbi:MAG: DEAD/DEAH box helicase [Chloroflexi bacterium]|nr:MAG: DEAD/DEAH box helicase [Chloroflexota bacterium]TMD73127.1 MAG: DEAD/DEAH box helicase [Chloroflexota bacterium]
MKAIENLVDEFEASLPFQLDPFQREAIDKLERGRGGVLVSAPTSSGKTIVAEYAIFRALQDNAKVLYTTPLKALSNQKYHDFVRAYGEGTVGLVTGENTINDDAPVVVMTTEILRNLIYEDPGRLDLVRYVVLDEVHYIDDFPRGSVWEEIVIQAPQTIKLVGLSATIGNYREIADWMAENRGGMETVFHDVRPVELKMWLAINNRFYPLFKDDGGIDQRTWGKGAQEEEASYRLGGYKRLPSNDLLHVIEELRRFDMLPAIYFIFSRRGCREALQRCAYHELDLTTAAEKEAIDRVAAERLQGLKDQDEEALFRRMVDARLLRRGMAEHHAGLLPYHKEMVEELFQRGLIKVVFATETLSLGINMPARGVVVSSFTKFDGVNFSTLTTGELTQLMGRAGRRGIDVIGHGAILKESDVEVGTIYEVAMGPTLVVESKFLPSYNMALNLLRVYTPEEAEALMQRSFGQFQKRLAEAEAGERLRNAREQLADITRMWDDPEVSIEDVRQYYKLEDRRRAIRIELRRLRREGGAQRRVGRGRSGGRGRALSSTARIAQRLEVEAKGLLERQRKLKVVRSPRFGDLLQKFGEIRTLQQELERGQREVTGQMDEYPRKLRRLSKILEETGFLAKNKPTDKGLFAARVYGENTILVTEAVWLGWFEGLTPEELCAVVVMLAAEDRERRGDRQAHGPRRYPTPAIAQTARLIRSLYFRFADMERELDEPNLRQPSHDYIDFAYRWSSGDPLDRIPLPANVDIGDAIKAMKALYSLLRQLEFALRQAKSPLLEMATRAVALMERDVIKRTY